MFTLRVQNYPYKGMNHKELCQICDLHSTNNECLWTWGCFYSAVVIELQCKPPGQGLNPSQICVCRDPPPPSAIYSRCDQPNKVLIHEFTLGMRPDMHLTKSWLLEHTHTHTHLPFSNEQFPVPSWTDT